MLSVALIALLSVVSATVYPEAPPVFLAKDYTKVLRRSGRSSLGEINIDFTGEDGASDNVKMKRLDLVGDARTRGYDHGYLLARDILKFVNVDLNKYFADMVLGLEFDTSGFPQALQDIFSVLKVKGAAAAPAVFNEAFAWVYAKELEYMPQSLIDEMDGIGEGMCAQLGGDCDSVAMGTLIKNVNMLPELIRMACTAYGAWGKANMLTNNGTLVQMRALDFGTGPFAPHTVIVTHRQPGKRAFMMVSFPGFVGAITGIAQDGVGISEKVWMVPDSITGLQPGHYTGEPDVFVLREILENFDNKEDAEAWVQSISRTFAMYIGIGDFSSQELDIIAYRETDAVVYTDETIPSQNGNVYLEDVNYVDKHVQPSTSELTTFLTEFYGSISLENSQIAVRYHKTGDVHYAAYDYGQKRMFVAIGKVNDNGEYGPEGGDLDSWKAFNRPAVQFDLDDLWNGK